MYKIKFIPTGHIFELPDNIAQELKEKFPEDYKILEKNGKKYRDKFKKKIESEKGSILEKVIDKKEVLGRVKMPEKEVLIEVVFRFVEYNKNYTQQDFSFYY